MRGVPRGITRSVGSGLGRQAIEHRKHRIWNDETLGLVEVNIFEPLWRGEGGFHGVREPRPVYTSYVGTWEVSKPPCSDTGPHREGGSPKPMMNGFEKSDLAIVAMKSTNKDLSGPAESMERRAGAKGNPSGQSTRRAQERGSVSQAVERIRQAAKRNPKQKLVSLLHHISVDALHEAYLSLKRKAASGVDGVTWSTYADGLMDRLSDLHDHVHSGAYRALPSRRVYIPKADGSKRPLGIAALEDKIVQKALTDVILVPIYETEFLGFSYGFRPQRSAHDALDALAVGIARRKVNWILDADIRGFFDTVHRDWLIRFLEHRIGDKRVIRLIIKWLNAGVMEEGQWSDTGKGTPQGAIVSPVLANIYLHYVFDLWTKVWRSKRAVGDVIVVRYADDFGAPWKGAFLLRVRSPPSNCRSNW